MKPQIIIGVLLSGALWAAGCANTSSSYRVDNRRNSLVGAWRGKVQFQSGAFSTVKDLEFMYVFNEGGTMTESSNYDASPPVPPAYGAWRKIKPGHFKATYAFYLTKAPAAFDDIVKGGGWPPVGHGVFVESIVLSADGTSFRSTIHYNAFDPADKPIESGSVAENRAVRIGF